MVLCDASVDRVEDDADQHEAEAEVSERAEDVAAFPCEDDKGGSKYRRDDEVREDMPCEKTPELHKHCRKGYDGSRYMAAVNLSPDTRSCMALEHVSCYGAGDCDNQILQVAPAEEPSYTAERRYPGKNLRRVRTQSLQGYDEKQHQPAEPDVVFCEHPDESSEDRHIGQDHYDHIAAPAAERKPEPVGCKHSHHYEQEQACIVQQPCLPFILYPDQSKEHDAPKNNAEESFYNVRTCAGAYLVGVSKHYRKDGEGEPPSEKAARYSPSAYSVFQSLAHCKREGRSHREKEEWEDKVDPCDSGNIRVELICRRRGLAVEHPCRQVRLISNVRAEDHCEDRDSAQNVDCDDSLVLFCHKVMLFFDDLGVDSTESVSYLYLKSPGVR